MNDHFLPSALRYHQPLEPRETGPGFAARLAAMNGRRMGEMFNHMGIPPYAVDNGDDDAIRIIAALGAADPERLIANTPHVIDGKREYHVAGEILGPLGINRTFFRYCPHCAIEDDGLFEGPRHARPWLRLEWTISHYRACHRHHAFLVAADPVRRRFQPFDFAETMETLLPDLKAIAATTTAAATSRFDQWLVDRTDGVRGPGNWLDTLPLYVAAQWCEAFGVSMLHPAKVQTSKLTETQWAAAAEEGFRISSAGADSIRGALEQLTRAEKATRGILGPRDTYGYGFQLLQKTIKDDAFEPIRALVRDCAMDALPWKIGTDMLGVIIEENRVVTVTTAAQIAGADRKTIRKVFRRNGLATEDLAQRRRDHRTVTAADQVMPALRKLKGALTAPQTMERLGIERRQLDAIVEAGGLADASGAAPGMWEQARYAPEDIDAMVERLMESAVEVAVPGPRQVDIPTARHMAGATTVDVLKLIFGKRLAWKGHLAGRNDYMGLLLDADEVTRLVRDSTPPIDGFLFKEVPDAIIGLNENSVTRLVTLKKLDEDEEYSPAARRLVPVITRDSVEAFRRQYVTAGELCQVHGLHHKQVRSILGKVGIDEEFDAKAVKTTIYDRVKVEVAARRTGFWEYRK
jgi:hypothetical protein